MNPQLVHHIAQLANIPITTKEEEDLAKGFETTLEVVDQITNTDTTHVEATNQVTSLENVWRDDVVDALHMLSQEDVLSNAKRTQNGYFVVPQIIEEN